jgi:hypothetical protein
VLDDQRSGRLAWRKAHQSAQIGLEALDRDDVELATLALRQATALAAAAEEVRPKKKSRATLTTSAKRRGRKKENEERNRRLVAAVEAQEAQGLTGKPAYDAAIKSDPELAVAFKGMLGAGIRKILREAKKT